MTRRALIIIAILAAALTASAQRQPKLSEEQVQQGLAEIRNYKHRMFTKELDLKKEQEQKFFDVYDKMDDELFALGTEMRELERKTYADAQASDLECSTVARALFEQKKKEAEIELRYYDQFADVLTPRQLLKLKGAERKISMNLAKYHGRKHNPHKK